MPLPDPAPPGRDVLLVDDSRMQRRILRASLERWGFRVAEAGEGEEALEICRSRSIDIVISDWMMPGMSGLEFCQAFRRLPRAGYGYFILLTSKSETGEVVHGLEGGADDFLTKPVNASELRARLSAGERILGMERELTEKNRLLGAAFSEISTLYDALNRDLQQARKLQQSLVPAPVQRIAGSQVSLMLRPSGHVGGDLVGAFAAGAGHLCLFCIDVSGHGVTSALMTARLAGLLSEGAPERNIALVPDGRGGHGPRPPAAVAAALNQLLLQEIESDTYLTLLLAVVDLGSGAVAFVQAGHPHPAIHRADGRVEMIGAGGLPVGLIEGASFEDAQAQLAPGDRLLIVSDGVTECADASGRQLSEDGLARLMDQAGRSGGPAYLDTMLEGLRDHAEGADLSDDVSAVLFEYRARGDGVN
ncbi:sigma-B regulation protein RsbU (phosphoserine phosphatase) [Rhodovulum iodosum]|uniref:Sigma-B regulation protein RsbU (Phosphoserine phosphatase) n=1 Tax=Rhodovulum iodosum TaxID=68291 RepID=A0ABV3XS20_9RHOB|nr:SpoIIE family protein phosphatase [Rhodovulum robiginosum]RSK30339.1 fused response regulator/phosphatase [Rhodovulum robiginosum]